MNMKLNQKINRSLWILLLMYLLINVGLGSWITVKVLADQNQNLPEEQYAQVMTNHQNHPFTRIRERFIPVWNYNNLIYPSLFSLAVLSTLVSYYLNKKPQNQRFEAIVKTSTGSVEAHSTQPHP